MSLTTYYVVQPFELDNKGHLVPKPAQQVPDKGIAIRRAERLAAKGGAVAFSRSGDLSTGDFDDAVILAQFGLVPEAEAIS